MSRWDEIFLTVGTQLPFDRLVEDVDCWIQQQPEARAFGQLSDGTYLPQHFPFCNFLGNAAYAAAVRRCSLIVSHAGMGSILTAIEAERPIIIMPRDFSLNEHRSDHQMATAAHMQQLPGVYVARNRSELHSLLDNRMQLQKAHFESGEKRVGLVSFVRNFIVAPDAAITGRQSIS